MSEYITTYTGVRFYPTAPKAEDIKIEDVAHALSLMCRGNGHVRSFFSVGQHCIACAKEAEASGCSERIILACLLHDASEAYMSDVPRPFKKEIPKYNEWEDKLLDVIYEKYLGSTLTEEERREIKRIDDLELYYDLKNILSEPPKGEAPFAHIEPSYDVRPFEEVEAEYLSLFHKYYK